MAEMVLLRNLVKSFGDSLEAIFKPPLPVCKRGAPVRVVAHRRPFEILDPPVAVLYFDDLRLAKQRILDDRIIRTERRNQYGVRFFEVTHPVPFDLPFQVSLYAKDFHDYLEMTQRLVANWKEHCVVAGVGVDLKSIDEQSQAEFGVYGRIFRYNAWVWLASLPEEIPEVLEVDYFWTDVSYVFIDTEHVWPET